MERTPFEADTLFAKPVPFLTREHGGMLYKNGVRLCRPTRYDRVEYADELVPTRSVLVHGRRG